LEGYLQLSAHIATPAFARHVAVLLV
jgi:hypothetical protein